MCGIVASHGVERPFSHLTLKSLRKRGPDQIGFWTDHDLVLSMTRLAIIGLDERGLQPMENDSYILIYNGEVYNFNALKDRLEAEGEDVRGANDAMVVLKGWTRWGSEILKEMTGFWAFILYDKKARKLILVRDQLGIKPLYYWAGNGFACAASRLATILDVVHERPELDYETLSEYVRYQFTFGDKTFFKSIKKVLPGHLVEIDLASHRVEDRCYENILGIEPDPDFELTPEWMKETRALLEECVLESTISDTSYTTFCSGGIDSSLITRITVPEVAYHCNFSDPECNETFYALQVVQDIKTRLLVVNGTENFNVVDRLRDIVIDYDELTVGSVIFPLDDILAHVRRRYKVVLTGTGGDELFGGYVRYQLSLGECFQDSYKALFARMKGTADVGERFEMTHRKGDPKIYRFYDGGALQRFKDAYEGCRVPDNDVLTMLRFDRRYFLQALLNIDDKMSGRHSLESRPSLLNQRLVRHLGGLGAQVLSKDGDLKPVLRDLAQGLLPRSVTHRTDKMGFTTPVGTFINQNSHLIRDHVMSSKFRHLYDLKGVNFTAETKFSREIFGLLILDLWLNQYAS